MEYSTRDRDPASPLGRDCQTPWFALRVRSNYERVTAIHLRERGYEEFAPCYQTERQWTDRRKRLDQFIFPGYVFFRCAPWLTRIVQENKYVARILHVPDQKAFERQLEEIMCALQSGHLVVRGSPVDVGTGARIKTGPLAGISGKVVKIANQVAVVLCLNFIGQGAAVMIDIADLEIVD